MIALGLIDAKLLDPRHVDLNDVVFGFRLSL